MKPGAAGKNSRGGLRIIWARASAGGKYDSEGCNAALDEWREIDTGIRAEEKETELFETDPEMIKLIHFAHRNRVQWKKEYPNKTYDEAKKIVAALETHRRLNVQVPKEKTVEWHVESFIKFKTAQEAADQKSPGRLRNIRTYLHRFRDFIGKQNVIEMSQR